MTARATIRLLLPCAAALVAAGGLLIAGPPAPTGACIRATVPATVVLPDGTVHPPGDLTLCLERHLSPVAEFHQISIAGAPMGLYAGRPMKAEMRVARPYVVFRRNVNDEWILVGFVRPARHAKELPTRVRLTDPERVRELAAIGREERPATGESVVLAPSDENGEFLLAAR